MNFQQNNHDAPGSEFNAGGFAHMPPTVCLLSANVEPPGAAGTNRSGDRVTVRPMAVNFLELIA